MGRKPGQYNMIYIYLFISLFMAVAGGDLFGSFPSCLHSGPSSQL